MGRRGWQGRAATEAGRSRDTVLAVDKVFGKHSVRAVLLTRPETVTRLLLGRQGVLPPRSHRAGAPGRDHSPSCCRGPSFAAPGASPTRTSTRGRRAHHARPLLTEADSAGSADARVVVWRWTRSPTRRTSATILRSAAFFGVDALLVMKNRAAEVTPLVARVAVGGAELVETSSASPIWPAAWRSSRASGFWVYGLDERGERTLAADRVRRQDRAGRRRRGRGAAPAHQAVLRRAGPDPGRPGRAWRASTRAWRPRWRWPRCSATATTAEPRE